MCAEAPVRGSPEIIPARRGFSVSYEGKTLLSRIDPVAQGERLAAELPMEERTLYLCPSPLYGYGLSELLKRLKPHSAILCIEADEKLYELSLKEIDSKLALTKATSVEGVCTFVRESWGTRTFRRVKTLRLTGGWQLFPELYENIEAALRREIALDWGNAMTLIRLGRLYARNLIRNLAHTPNSENIGSLDFSSSAVLVLGAGPSLDSFLLELAAVWGGKIPSQSRRRFKIVCADTCLSALLEREIIPDLVVILESQHWNLGDFVGVQGRKIDAALDLSALPASARVLNGKRYFFTTPWTELNLFRRLEKNALLPKVFPPLGSVGLSAVALALYAGSGPVLTAGIDFSFTLDTSHARSTPAHSRRLMRQNRLTSIVNASAAFRDGTFYTVSKSGERVRSNPIMRNYRELFEQEFGRNTQKTEDRPNTFSRLLDINGTGLPLGVKTISAAEAFVILNEAGKPEQSGICNNESSFRLSEKTELGQIAEFIRKEMDDLQTIKDMLSGIIPSETARLEELLVGADYLWAHFPECAGTSSAFTAASKTAGHQPPFSDLSFLKRVRTEIEPFLRLWQMTLGELEGLQSK